MLRARTEMIFYGFWNSYLISTASFMLNVEIRAALFTIVRWQNNIHPYICIRNHMPIYSMRRECCNSHLHIHKRSHRGHPAMCPQFICGKPQFLCSSLAYILKGPHARACLSDFQHKCCHLQNICCRIFAYIFHWVWCPVSLAKWTFKWFWVVKVHPTLQWTSVSIWFGVKVYDRRYMIWKIHFVWNLHWFA